MYRRSSVTGSGRCMIDRWGQIDFVVLVADGLDARASGPDYIWWLRMIRGAVWAQCVYLLLSGMWAWYVVLMHSEM